MDRVTLVGPASPKDLAHRFSGADRTRAQAHQGYRGVPVSELAIALVDAGFTVEIVTTSSEITSPTTYEGERLSLTAVPMRTRARARALDLFADERKELERALRSTSGDVVHAHWTYEFAWAALSSNRDVLVTAQDAPLSILWQLRDAYRLLRTALAYRVRPLIRELTAVSPYSAKQLRWQMAYRNRIAVIPNIAARRPQVNGHRNGVPVILELSDSSRRKNVENLVRAHAILLRRGVNVELQLAGPGLGEADELARGLATEGLGEAVTYCGRIARDDLASRLTRASVFAHSSYEEGCPMAVLEAMAAGVPVVGGVKAGGVPWVLDGGNAGLLVDVRSPEAIAAGIERLLEQPEEARALARRASARVEERFSAEAVVASYVEEYERIRTGAKR